MTTPEELLREIRQRTDFATSQAEICAYLAKFYSVELELKNFKDGKFLLFDNSNRSIEIQHGDIRENMIHVWNKSDTDIVVFTTGEPPAIIGWTHTKNLKHSEDRYIVNINTLYSLPQDFDFIRPCPHLEVYGGVFVDEEQSWKCFGCGLLIP